MHSKIIEIFQDQYFINKVKNKLPQLFHLAELESSRAGKIGMEVGSVREKIITSLFLTNLEETTYRQNYPLQNQKQMSLFLILLFLLKRLRVKILVV